MTKVVVNDSVLRHLIRSLSSDYYVKVGVLADSGSHDTMTMVELAAIHEFGSPRQNIPERSFIRRTLEEKQGVIASFISTLAGRVIRQEMDVELAHEQLGAMVAGMIKGRVTQGPHIPPPLQSATVKRKGSSRPLVDTGRLMQSISHQVVKGSFT